MIGITINYCPMDWTYVIDGHNVNSSFSLNQNNEYDDEEEKDWIPGNLIQDFSSKWKIRLIE